MATAAVALSLVLGGCGGSSSKAPEPPPVEPPEPMPVDVSGEIMLIKEQKAALLKVLPDNGDSVELSADADGVTRAGVTFTCMSAYPCTVTVSNSAGTIVATWASQTLGDGTASAMAAGLEPRIDRFAVLNAGSTAAIRAELNPTAGDNARTTPNWQATELIGMGIGGPGVLDASKAGLRSALDPNGAALAGHANDADDNPTTFAIANPGASPDLRKGSTITSAEDALMPSDAEMAAPASRKIAPAPAGWTMKTLFRDWGDTAGSGDGGYETGAIVVQNLGEGTPYPFDRKLSAKYINTTAQNMFALNIRADGSAPGVTTLGTSVDINSSSDANNTATATQWANMVFDSTSLVPAQSQDPNIDSDETFTGMYFGAPGRFQCIEADTGTSCGLERNADGAVMVIDTSAATEGIQGGGRWSFTPDPGAMITVPDQDWMAYGAWLTTPDDAAGAHRFGVFFNGMDAWTAAENALTATEAAGLRGSATYSGGATGVYVDGADSGLFTARAMLTADFDKNSSGTDEDGVDYRISGRIDNFRGTDGMFLGADTAETPNDPVEGGENDWVVVLGGLDIAATGVIANTATSGSADGVSWSGQWNGNFFGPSSNADGALAPSGVAGRFWANTGDPDGTGDGNPLTVNDAVTSVVGSFGATKD